MPTIKLKGGNVLIKNGKASCACCDAPETCCMYEAGLLGDTYNVDDLPDAILIDGENAGKVSSIPNRGSIEVGYWKGGTPADGDYCVAHTGGTSWRFEQYNADSEEWNEIGESSDCLFGGLFKPSGYLVEDQFADCYEVDSLEIFGSGSGALGSSYCEDVDDWAFNYADPATFSDVVFTRVSLCVWEAGVTVTIKNGCDGSTLSSGAEKLRLIYEPGEEKFLLEFTNTQFFGLPVYKTPPQSSPDGDYGGITVTEC
jgi:hypothetical protein